MAILYPCATNSTVSNTTVSKEIRQILENLTLEEKVGLLSGRNFVSTLAIPRLKIPSIKRANSTSAVKGANFGDPLPTACFPNTSALAATWNRDLLQAMGKAIAGQVKFKTAQLIIGPTVNIHRDPRAGRNFESFSEDPVLTGQLGASLVNGIQSQGVGVCLKHFVCNDSETGRKEYSSNVDNRTLRELYAAPFQWIVKEANPLAIMMAYNKVNGTYCSESPMIRDIIREEWGFQGLLMSDWYGTQSTELAVQAGLDLEMPGPSKWRGHTLIDKVESGRIAIKVIDERVREVLKFISRTSDVHSTAKETAGFDEATNALARQVASECMVLLKNRGQVLPLDMKSLPRIAISGKLALEYSGGGGSAGGIPHYVQRPYDCIKKLHPQPDFVTISEGIPLHRGMPLVSTKMLTSANGKPGVDVTYYNEDETTPIFTEMIPHASVLMLGHVKSGLKEQTGFVYEITTTLKPSSSGKHNLGVVATGAFQLFVNGNEVLSSCEPEMSVEDFLFKSFDLEKRCTVPMCIGQSYSIRLRVHSRRSLETTEPTPHSAKLCFLEEYSNEARISEAVEAASKADVSVVFAGRCDEWESEGSDMDSIKLPSDQDQLIKSVAKASSKTVVVLYGGNPFDVSEWIEDVDAVIFAHYPGQEGGAALADVLTGVVSPSGKLPMSWPRNIEGAPTFGNFPASLNRNNDLQLNYAEGLRIGYRYYGTDAGRNSLRWSFGHGLSYTEFSIKDLVVTRSARENEDKIIFVEVTVTNSGAVAGAEVIQAYVEDVDASVWRPKRELKAFEKVSLQPQEKQVVKLKMLEKYALSFWDETSGQWLAEKGVFRIHVGKLSVTFVLEEDFSWRGV